MKHFLLKYFSLLKKKCFLVSIPVQEKTKNSQSKQPRKQIQTVFRHRFAYIFAHLLETKRKFPVDAGTKQLDCIEDVLCYSEAGCHPSSYNPQSIDVNILSEKISFSNKHPISKSDHYLPTFKVVSTTLIEKSVRNGTHVEIKRTFISDIFDEDHSITTYLPFIFVHCKNHKKG